MHYILGESRVYHKNNDTYNKGRLMIFLPVLPGRTFPSSTHFDEIFQSISDDPWEHDFILQSIMILSIVFLPS